jgi:type I restriction-modification system DNA methylase subunit
MDSLCSQELTFASPFKSFLLSEKQDSKMNGKRKVKSLVRWIWNAACSIRGAQDAAKFKDYVLPLIFVNRLCDVFDGEIDRIAEKVKSRTKALASRYYDSRARVGCRQWYVR